MKRGVERGRCGGESRLAALLELEVLDRDLFRGANEPGAGARMSLYGGQVAAQALRAAGATVPPDRLPHSLHGYFLRPGRVDRPVILHVDRDRDGESFSARHVRAVQDGEVIFSMVASFHAREDERDVRRGSDSWWCRSVDAAAAPVAVPRRGPRGDTDARRRRSGPPFRLAVGARRRRRCPTTRWCTRARSRTSPISAPGSGRWTCPACPAGGPSIDHSLWFHEPIRADEWMLLELWPLKASGSRGVYSGSLRSEDGRLGVLLTQEMLLRDRQLDPEMQRRIAEYLGVTPE